MPSKHPSTRSKILHVLRPSRADFIRQALRILVRRGEALRCPSEAPASRRAANQDVFTVRPAP